MGGQGKGWTVGLILVEYLARDLVQWRCSKCLPHVCFLMWLSVACLLVPPALQHAVSVKYATEHRCGVVVRGAGLTDRISGTDPLKDGLPLQARWAHWQGLLQRGRWPAHTRAGERRAGKRVGGGSALVRAAPQSSASAKQPSLISAAPH